MPTERLLVIGWRPCRPWFIQSADHHRDGLEVAGRIRTTTEITEDTEAEGRKATLDRTPRIYSPQIDPPLRDQQTSVIDRFSATSFATWRDCPILAR